MPRFNRRQAFKNTENMVLGNQIEMVGSMPCSLSISSVTSGNYSPLRLLSLKTERIPPPHNLLGELIERMQEHRAHAQKRVATVLLLQRSRSREGKGLAQGHTAKETHRISLDAIGMTPVAQREPSCRTESQASLLRAGKGSNSKSKLGRNAEAWGLPSVGARLRAAAACKEQRQVETCSARAG